ATGNARPVTPEGVIGAVLSPDGTRAVVTSPDGSYGVWPLQGGNLRPIPNLDNSYTVADWTPDGKAVYVNRRANGLGAQLQRVDVATGNKTPAPMKLGEHLPSGASIVGRVRLSQDNKSYVYIVDQTLSQAYLVKGMQ